MSVASEITRLQNAKASLKTSINAKTDLQHQITDETLEDYADFVDSITTGGISLPDTYTRLAWLTSSGTQYIDTGYKPNANSVVKILCGYMRSGGIMGARIDGSTDRYFLAAKAFKESNVIMGGHILLVYNDSLEVESNTNTLSYSYVSISQSEFNVNNESYSNINITDYPDLSIYLFAINTNGTANAFCSGSIGGFQVYENNVLVHNFIPCYRNSDSVKGFYDVITNEFKTNSGTGSFTSVLVNDYYS